MTALAADALPRRSVVWEDLCDEVFNEIQPVLVNDGVER